MKKGIVKWIDPILLVGLFISILISIGMVLVGNDTINSFIVGLLSTIITLLVDLITRLNRAEQNVIETQKFAQILMSGPISQDMQMLARDYEIIEGYDFELYRRIAIDSISQCKQRFREIAAGAVVIPDMSVYHYNVEGIQQAQRSIKVTHISSLNYWISDAGQKFLEAGRAVLKRGIETTIVFAISDEQVQESRNILDMINKSKIRVFTTKPKRIDQEFMLIDDKVLLQYEYDKNEDIWKTRIILDSDEVDRAVVSWHHILDFAKPY
jgi:hypothetical protein